MFVDLQENTELSLFRAGMQAAGEPLNLRINGKVCFTGDSGSLLLFYANISGLNFSAERSGIADTTERDKRYADYLDFVESQVGEPVNDVALFQGNTPQLWYAVNPAVTQPSTPVEVQWDCRPGQR